MFDPSFCCPVFVLGAGSIGSFVVEGLAKMGFSDITVQDHDIIDSHNCVMSAYPYHALGEHKVARLARRVSEDVGIDLKVIPKRYEGGALQQSLVICCVDSMDTRRKLWKEVQGAMRHRLFLDTRTAGAYTELYRIVPYQVRHQKYYEATLQFTDAEAAPQTCGLHGSVYQSQALAAQVCKSAALVLQGRALIYPEDLRAIDKNDMFSMV
jgi:molybdopterin/thiamine biosynthesis adenylyltransferase